MLTTSTPEVVNPVADACEAAGVPSLGTVDPWESFYFGRGGKPGKPSPFKWSFCLSFGTAAICQDLSVHVGQDEDQQEGRRALSKRCRRQCRARASRAAAEKGGYTIVDPGPYEDGTTDYSAQIALFKREHCEIFNTFPIPPDFAAFWRQAAQQGYTRMVKIAQIAKTGLFPSRCRGARQSRLQSRRRRLLAQGLPLQVVADRRIEHAACRRLRKKHRQAVGTAARRFDVAA